MQGGGGRLAEDVQESSAGRRGRSRGGQGRDESSGTGTSDPTYGLVSTAYHLLQGAETIQQYMDDAKREGDKDLLKFLRQVHRGYVKNAEQAKQLLSERLDT
jgi:hypothetical protein